MQFRVLGPLEVLDDAAAPIRLGGHKQRAVLARLLLQPNEIVSADALADAAWDGATAEHARGILQVYVANLRRLLDAGIDTVTTERIPRRAGGYQLVVGDDELDLARFRRLVA